MCVQRTLTRKETINVLLETRAGADSHDMSEEDILDESEPAAYLTLMEERRTAIGKLVKEMVHSCSFYDVSLKTLAEELKLGVAEKLSRQGDFVLVDPQ